MENPAVNPAALAGLVPATCHRCGHQQEVVVRPLDIRYDQRAVARAAGRDAAVQKVAYRVLVNLQHFLKEARSFKWIVARVAVESFTLIMISRFHPLLAAGLVIPVILLEVLITAGAQHLQRATEWGMNKLEQREINRMQREAVAAA